jgi:plastocyanin
MQTPAGSARYRSVYTTLTIFGLAIVFVLALVVIPALLVTGEYEVLVFIIPNLVIPAIIAWLVARFGSWAFWVAAVGGLLVLLFSLQSLGIALQYPDSFYDFMSGIGNLVGGLIIVASAIAGFFHERRHPGQEPSLAPLARRGMAGVTGVLVLLGAISAVLTFTGKESVSDADRSGAALVRMEGTDFAPASLELSTQSRVLVENHDAIVHTFTVDAGGGHAVNEGFTPGSEKIISLASLAPGDYTFYCDVPGHEDMKGTLKLTP